MLEIEKLTDELAFTKTLGIPKNYYTNTSNSSKYQQPTLSGKRLSIMTNPNAPIWGKDYQSATVAPGATVEPTTPPTIINSPIYLSNLQVLDNNSLNSSPSAPFYCGTVGTYNGNLNYFNYQIPSEYPSSSFLVIQSNDLLRIDISPPQGLSYSFGNLPVVVNGGQITLTISDYTGYGGVYSINPVCNSYNDGMAGSCINPSTQSSYTQMLNTYFPAGLYFNIQISS